MVAILFRPFQLGKWLTIAFSAWLATLLDRSNLGEVVNFGEDRDSVAHGMGDAALSLRESLVWLLVAGAIFAALLVLFVVLLWVSSRAKFIFLDNVIHDRGRIKEPWTRFTRPGDSLFLWLLGFSALVLILMIVAVGLLILLVGIDAATNLGGALPLGGVIYLVLLGFALVIPLLYLYLFLDDFVVPVMIRANLSTSAAWRRLLALVKAYPLEFLFYGLCIFAFYVLVAMAVAAITLLTCCVGGILLTIPYVGTVFLLPVLVLHRIYSLEFLAQFGPEYELLPPLPPGPPAPSPEPSA